MQIDLVTIQRHAGEKLRKIENQPNPAQRLIALKKFLKIETQRLSLRHRFGISGEQIVQARSLIVDLLIERISRAAVEEKFGDNEAVAQITAFVRAARERPLCYPGSHEA